MRELSAFADESGDSAHQSKYYLLTLVFHDQGKPIVGNIARYESALREAGLPDIAFHMGPLVNGHGDYENLSVGDRKRLLARFFSFAVLVPVRYKTFVYKKKEVPPEHLVAKMKQDMVNYLFSNIEFFQGFDTVKVYYDRGQKLVTGNLRAAISYVLGSNAPEFKDGNPAQQRLAQVADLLCGVELAALKFAAGEQSATDTRIFRDARNLKQNYLKQLRRKVLS
jgi:hypothetical protein